MALVPATAASAITSSYMSLIGGGSPNFPADFANAYDAYAKAGALSAGGAVSGSENKAIIQSFLAGLTGNSTPAAFGKALCDYWATAFLVPAGTISVVSNAASKESLFVAAIEASITTSDTKPYFQTLIANIQSIAVSQIQWTVTLPTIPPTIRVETIS